VAKRRRLIKPPEDFKVNKQKMIALAVSGAVIYIAATGAIKSPVATTAMIAVGSVVALRQLPLVGQYA
jgi:hypothetical protein